MFQPPIFPIAIIIVIAAVHGELHPRTCWASQITCVNHSRTEICHVHTDVNMVDSDKKSYSPQTKCKKYSEEDKQGAIIVYKSI